MHGHNGLSRGHACVVPLQGITGLVERPLKGWERGGLPGLVSGGRTMDSCIWFLTRNGPHLRVLFCHDC